MDISNEAPSHGKGTMGICQKTAFSSYSDSEGAHSRYEKDKQKAMATVVMGIQSNLIYLVKSCTTQKDLWDTLKAQFERNTLANKLFLKRQYFTTKMKEGQSVQDHLKNMQEIVDKLAAPWIRSCRRRTSRCIVDKYSFKLYNSSNSSGSKRG